MWANGGFSAANVEESAIRNAGAVGYCNALSELLDIDAQVLGEFIDE